VLSLYTWRTVFLDSCFYKESDGVVPVAVVAVVEDDDERESAIENTQEKNAPADKVAARDS
jgi:hypothetical protein